MEDGAAAHVGIAFVDRGVGVGGAGKAPRPIALDAGDDAGAHPLADLDGALEFAPVVEDAGRGTVGEATGGGVIGVENDGESALARLLALDIGEGGIEEVVGGGGDQAKGIAARQVGVLLGGLVRLGVAGQGIEAVRLHARRMELELAGRRREALGEGRRCYVEAHPPGFLEALQGDALAPQVVGIEDGARQVVVAVEQAGLI